MLKKVLLISGGLILVALVGSTSHELSEWIGPRPLVLVFGSFT